MFLITVGKNTPRWERPIRKKRYQQPFLLCMDLSNGTRLGERISLQAATASAVHSLDGPVVDIVRDTGTLEYLGNETTLGFY
jgi:hypothetical protein